MASRLGDPDVTSHRHSLTAERVLAASRDVLYRAWTERFDLWFAAPDSVLMTPEVDVPFYFETQFEGRRHPHYGRFVRLEPESLVELTWVTGAGGTEGAETVVTVELAPRAAGTHLRLTHAGFASAAACRQHRDAWPLVLAQLDERTAR
jgi:uncharacterized protein YndB with AHSA1/START domain